MLNGPRTIRHQGGEGPVAPWGGDVNVPDVGPGRPGGSDRFNGAEMVSEEEWTRRRMLSPVAHRDAQRAARQDEDRVLWQFIEALEACSPRSDSWSKDVAKQLRDGLTGRLPRGSSIKVSRSQEEYMERLYKRIAEDPGRP